jgi:hypothetical protein
MFIFVSLNFRVFARWSGQNASRNRTFWLWRYKRWKDLENPGSLG